MKLKFYGCRGSVAISRQSRYGGNTSSMIVESKEGSIILDAGSGILSMWNELGKNGLFPSDILLSHLHLDHTIGLGTLNPIWNNTGRLNIYTCSRDERPLHEQICAPFTPPQWPAPMAQNGKINAVEIKDGETFTVGAFTVTAFKADHPDNTLSFHMTCGDKTIVHLLDSETPRLNEHELSALASYCKGADLVVYDAAYSCDDYLKRYVGWGHSTVKHGVELAKEWGCKKMVFSHFDQKYTDDELDSWALHFPSPEDCATEFIMARDGLELEI